MTRVQIRSIPAPSHHASGAALDLHGDRVCFASGTTIYVCRLTTDRFEQESSLAVPFTPDHVALADSSNLVMLRRADGRQIWTTDLRDPATSVSIDQHEVGRQRLVACFGRCRGQDLLLCSRTGSKLEVFVPGAITPSWTIDCETFRFGALLPVGDAVIVTGCFAGETKDSLAVLDLQLAESDPSSMFSRFREKTLVNDYAYELAAGPA